VEGASPIAFELLAGYIAAIQTRTEFTVEPADVTGLSGRVARVIALGPDDGMLAREMADALGMTESPEYAAEKVWSVLRAHAAFVEISRGRWQLGHRATTEPPPLPYDQQQERMGRALEHLLKATAERIATSNDTGPTLTA
jgi:hypothetical protein